MKYFGLCLLLLSSLVWAVPDRSVYPNSGDTNAKVDPITDIGGFSNNPINQGAGAQKQEERPVEDPDAILVGPYDKDGNYQPTLKKVDQTPIE